MRILTEASGSLTAGYIIKAIIEGGFEAIASDILEDSAGKYLANDFIKFPHPDDPKFWEKVYDSLNSMNVNVVIPSLDETLLEWSRRKKELLDMGIHVIISDEKTMEICQDKWLTYNHFISNNIPTPKSSLNQLYPLVKPRNGRGGQGIIQTKEKISMNGNISQELVEGIEYTIDVFCDKDSNPVYIIPRKRMNIREGKSLHGITVLNEKIIEWVKKICSTLNFIGPINIQCFEKDSGEIVFIEINPRLAGGMALGFKASDNWIKLAMDNIVDNKSISPKKVQFGLMMMRYYEEVYTTKIN